MAATNNLYKLKANGLARNTVWQEALDKLVACIAPFAPHAAEEMWRQLGHGTTVHRDSWPSWDEAALRTDEVTIVIQVNGKVRGQIESPAEAEEAIVVATAKAEANVATHLEGKQIVKTIYVPGKLVNFAVR